MGFEIGGVDHQPTRLTSLARHLGENLVEHAKTAPAHESVVDDLVRTIATWSITLAKPIADDKDDPADDQPIIHPWNAMRVRKLWLDPAHLRFRKQK
jgi:hypothetical protein